MTDLLVRRGAAVVNPGSIALLGGLVADGKLDGTIFPGTDPRETAAMALIATEAGGQATDINGQPLDYRGKKIAGHIISNGPMHQQLVNAVRWSQAAEPPRSRQPNPYNLP